MTKNIKFTAIAILIAALLVPATSFAVDTQNSRLSATKEKQAVERVRATQVVTPAASLAPVRKVRSAISTKTSVGARPAAAPVAVATSFTATTTTNADLNNDGIVDGNDLGTVLGQWGPCPLTLTLCLGDLNFDGVVDDIDVSIVLAFWGPVVPVVLTASAADFNKDGKVDGNDLGTLLGNWGKCNAENSCVGDLNGDGFVNQADIDILLKFWGPVAN